MSTEGKKPEVVHKGPHLIPGYDEIVGSLLVNKIPDAAPTDVLKVYGIIVNSVTPDGK